MSVPRNGRRFRRKPRLRSATVRSTAIPAGRRRFTCRGVVFAASALGTLDLLFRLKEKGSLPGISDQLGNRVRTNCESLIGVRVPGRKDLSNGIAIGSGFYLDDQYTHIEATRYPAGSDAMGLLATVLTGGKPGRARILLWLKGLAASLLRHPIRTVRILHPFGWARESSSCFACRPSTAISTCGSAAPGSGPSRRC